MVRPWILVLGALAVTNVARAEDRMIPVAQGVELFVHEEGRGSPIIVVHGGPGMDHNYLAPDLGELAKHHRVIYYDQRGSGGSTLTPAVKVDDLIADLDALRAALKLDHVVVLGHSWGGGLAALYAAMHPSRVSRLILVDSIPLSHTGITGFSARLHAKLTTDENTALAAAARREDAATTDEERRAACTSYWSIFIKAYYGDPAAVANERGNVCAASGAALANGFDRVNPSVFRDLGDWNWRPKLAAITMPTLIIHGEADPIPLKTAREWASAIKGSRLIVVPGAGHMTYVEAPDLFFRSVEAFLAGRQPADPSQ
jgi:proline iminopeptidase